MASCASPRRSPAQAACSALSWLLQAPGAAAADAAVRAGEIRLPRTVADLAFPKLADEPLMAARVETGNRLNIFRIYLLPRPEGIRSAVAAAAAADAPHR